MAPMRLGGLSDWLICGSNVQIPIEPIAGGTQLAGASNCRTAIAGGAFGPFNIVESALQIKTSSVESFFYSSYLDFVREPDL
jgi:hypothetical protein